MSVSFDLIFKDNQRIPLRGGCFGCLNYISFPYGNIRTNEFLPHVYQGMSTEQIRNICSELWTNHFEDLSFIQWHVTELNSIWGGTYYEEMKALIADIPWLNGVSVHSLLKVVRVDIGDAPADKVITTLFLMRNMAQYDHYARSYLAFRRTYNMRPYAAAIMSSLFLIGGGGFQSSANWRYNSVGEYNWLSPYTFGVNSLEAMLTQGPLYNPWFQDSFISQRGYHRDSWFQSNRVEFNGREEAREPSVRYNEFYNTYRRTIDCFSVPNDTPIFSETRLFKLCPDEDCIYHHWFYDNPNIDVVVAEFTEKCLSFGFNPNNP